MSIIGAILAKVLADRKGLPPDVANRFLVTGYVVGSATSPILSAIVSERLTQQEADKLLTPTTSTPSTPPTVPGQPLPSTVVLLAENYVGKPYEDTKKSLESQGIKVAQLVSKSDSKYDRGTIIAQFQPTGQQQSPFIMLEEGTLLIPGATVVFAVKSNESQIEVPLFEGLKIKDVETKAEEINKEKENFKFNCINEERAKKWLDIKIVEQITKDGAIVFDQEPEAGTKVTIGSTITLFILEPPSSGVSTSSTPS
jgi:PASTA domain